MTEENKNQEPIKRHSFNPPGVAPEATKFLRLAEENGQLDKLSPFTRTVILGYANTTASLRDLSLILKPGEDPSKVSGSLIRFYQRGIKRLARRLPQEVIEQFDMDRVLKPKDRNALRSKIKLNRPRELTDLDQPQEEIKNPFSVLETVASRFNAPRTRPLTTVFLRTALFLGLLQGLDFKRRNLVVDYFENDITFEDLAPTDLDKEKVKSFTEVSRVSIQRTLLALLDYFPKELRGLYAQSEIKKLKGTSKDKGKQIFSVIALEKQLDQVAHTNTTLGTFYATDRLIYSAHCLGIDRLLPVEQKYALNIYYHTRSSLEQIAVTLTNLTGKHKTGAEVKEMVLSALDFCKKYLPPQIQRELNAQSISLKTTSREQLENLPVKNGLKGGNEITDNWYTIVSTPGTLERLIEWKALSKNDAYFWDRYYLGYKEKEPSPEQKDRLSLAIAKLVINNII